MARPRIVRTSWEKVCPQTTAPARKNWREITNEIIMPIAQKYIDLGHSYVSAFRLATKEAVLFNTNTIAQ